MKKARKLPQHIKMSRLIIWLVLVIMAIQAFLFGNLLQIQQAGVFPVVDIGDYHIRLEEIVLIVGLGICLILIIARVSSRHAISLTHNYQSFLFIWMLVGLAQAALRGYLAHQPENMLETRMLVIPLFFYFMAYTCISYEWLPIFSKRISKLLLFPVLLLSWDSIMPIGESLDRTYSSLGWVYGGWGMGMMTLIIYFLCLIVSDTLFHKRIRNAPLILIMFIIAGLIVRISKPGWANMVAVFLFVTVLVLAMRNKAVAARVYHRRIRRWTVMVLAGSSLVLLVMFFYRGIFPERTENYFYEVESRTLRYDAGLDFTGGRLELFVRGLEKFAEAPIIGIGNGFWYEYWQGGNFSQRVPDHFGVLSVLIRGGVFSALPILLLVIWYLRRGFRVCRMTNDPSVQPFVIASYLYTLVIFFYSLFANPQNVLEASLLFWLSISVVLCAGREMDDGIRSGNKRMLKVSQSGKIGNCQA
jgi:hypothetical protein